MGGSSTVSFVFAMRGAVPGIDVFER